MGVSPLICYSPSPTDCSFLLLQKKEWLQAGKKTASFHVLIFLSEIHIVPEVLGLFISVVVLLPKTRAKNSVDTNTPLQVLASLCILFSHHLVFTPHPPEVWLCQERRQLVKESFIPTFACEVFVVLVS